MISNNVDQMTKFHWYDNTTRNYKRRNVTRFLSASLPQMFGLFKVLQKYFSLRTCVTWRDVCDESVSWARDKALGNEMGRGADSGDLLLYHTLSLFSVSLLQSTDPKSHVTYLICWHDIGVNVTPAQCATLCVTAWYRSNLGPDYLTAGILWRRTQWPWFTASWIILQAAALSLFRTSS